MTDAAWAEVVSAVALALLTVAFLFLWRRAVWVVTAPTLSYTHPDPLGRSWRLGHARSGGGNPRRGQVLIGGTPATVSGSQEAMGADHLTVQVPAGLRGPSVKMSAVRADGVAATGPGGTDSLTLTVD